MKSFFLIVFFFFEKNCFSQKKQNEVLFINQKYAVTVAPVFFPIRAFGIQPGFQFKISDQYAFISEIGIRIGHSKNSDYDKTSFLKFTTELKYFPKHSIPGRFYSLQFGYIKRNFFDNDSGSYHTPGSPDLIGYQSLKIKSPVFFTCFKIGREVVEWKKAFMDVFIGLGLRWIPTEYNAAGAYSLGNYYQPRDIFFSFIPISSWQYDKILLRPQISFGLRIGKRF